MRDVNSSRRNGVGRAKQPCYMPLSRRMNIKSYSSNAQFCRAAKGQSNGDWSGPAGLLHEASPPTRGRGHNILLSLRKR